MVGVTAVGVTGFSRTGSQDKTCDGAKTGRLAMMFDEYYRRTWEDTDHDISDKQTEFATSLRIPILATTSPRWNYITGIVVCDNILHHGIMPDEDEIQAVADHLAEYNKYYRPAFLDAMKAFAPYDIDGGANLGYYSKRPDGWWTYRKRTWSSPRFSDKIGELDEVLKRNFGGWAFTKREVSS